MSTKTEIANMAIAHVAVGDAIDDLDSDTSVIAKVARRFYEPSRKSFLRSHQWHFARKIVALSLEGTYDSSEGAWGYRYEYPSDCLYFRWISDTQKRPKIYDGSYLYQVNYELIDSTNQRVIYSDLEGAYGCYTLDITDAEFLPEDAALAMSYLLAMYIAPKITAGDNSQLVRDIQNAYVHHVGIARSNDANEGGTEPQPDSEMIQVRS